MMKSQPSAAEQTAAILLNKVSSAAVMIPGAFERRISAPDGAGGDSTGMPPDRAVAVSVRERSVYELEGGGAASERPAGRPASIFQKIWQRMRQGGEREISSR